MNIGVNRNFDKTTVQYYETFYDILRTPDFNDKSRLLKPEHGIKIIGSSHSKKCRFCGKNEEETCFSKIAHVFPEAIGNNVLASNYECDICNQYFGNSIENEYANFFSLYHSIMQIDGKDGIPKCCFKVPCLMRTDKCARYCVEIFMKDNMPCIRKCKEVAEQYISLSNNAITISKPVGKYCPIAVFKAIVKMAISVMPAEELISFDNTIKWLLEEKHSNFYSKRKLLIRYQMIPGFNVTQYPYYALYRRKRTIWNKPYLLFHLTYGCFSLLIEIPKDVESFDNTEFETLPFPPIPFYTYEVGIWDMSGVEGDKTAKHSIVLNFDIMKECTNNVVITSENGKKTINYRP